ncbi:Nn.00g090010.m01.CDS01 [Neocucurbitaria sp. VM-36]
MANPYLIQALYDPRPTNPAINDVKDTSSVTDTAAAPSTLPRTESLIETLYGSSFPTVAPTTELNHSIRQQPKESDKPMEEKEDESIPWVPPGPNVLIVSEKSDDAVLNPTPPCRTPTLSLESSVSHTVMSTTPSGALKYPPERYLPPPGLYYDQFSLPIIFGVGFFYDKCPTCWSKRHGSSKGAKCQRACTICGTKNHSEESCSLLYCTSSWYSERNISSRRASVRYRQIRPTDTELVVLQRVGLINHGSGRGDPVVPNMLHPLAQSFYYNKASPQLLDGLSTKFVEPQTSSPANTLLSGNVVNSSLDPRVQARITCNSTLSNQEKSTAVMKGTIVPEDAQAKVITSSQAIGRSVENKLQELENEVMKLKMENIVKDREIRNLRAENEQLRGGGYESGNKRPCI